VDRPGAILVNYFDELTVQGFRRLRDCCIPLRRLNVVIGANGCGKTSLLNVFSLLADSASGRLSQSLSEMGGINSNLTNLIAAGTGRPSSDVMGFILTKAIPDHGPLVYGLKLIPSGIGYQISWESFDQAQGKPHHLRHLESIPGMIQYFDPTPEARKFVIPNWDYNDKETALSQVPRMYKEPEEFRKGLASSTCYHALDVGERAP
jgi:predicted ATPase